MSGEGHWPTHAYIPGRNARHPEGVFDPIRETVHPGMPVSALATSPAFQDALRFLRAGYFWEAHEVLEPVWMALPKNSPERHFVQGLIQLANGRLKLLMGLPKASHRMSGMARKLLSVPKTEHVMGLDPSAFLQEADSLEQDAEHAL